MHSALDQDQEPGRARGEARGRGGVAIAASDVRCRLAEHLVVHESKIAEVALPDAFGEPFHQVAAADAQESGMG
jgi:hypothetical protein